MTSMMMTITHFQMEQHVKAIPHHNEKNKFSLIMLVF